MTQTELTTALLLANLILQELVSTQEETIALQRGNIQLQAVIVAKLEAKIERLRGCSAKCRECGEDFQQGKG